MNMPYENRGERFAESFEYIQQVWQSYPAFENSFGDLQSNMDLLPKPTAGKVPLMITGGSQQSSEWIAEHGDGWITYPRGIAAQQQVIEGWRGRMQAADEPDKPAVQSLYVDLVDDDNALPQPIHLGFRTGVNGLREYLQAIEAIGINHVALNLRLNQADTETTLQRLAEAILPEFSN